MKIIFITLGIAYGLCIGLAQKGFMWVVSSKALGLAPDDIQFWRIMTSGIAAMFILLMLLIVYVTWLTARKDKNES